MPPFFSIVVPTYNRAALLPRTFASVQAQTFTDWELVLVDDASTDGTRAWAQTIHDTRFRYLRNPQNRERSHTRNRGMAEVKGRYICFLDSDDEWHPDHLAELYAAIHREKEPVALFFTKHRYHFADGKTQDADLPPITGSATEYVLRHQPATPCVALHRNLLGLGFLFPENFSINEDVILYTRIAAHHTVFLVNAVTVTVNVHAEATTQYTKDIITPQMEAFRFLLADHEVRNGLSRAFIRQKRKSLLHQRINHRLGAGLHARRDLTLFLLKYPADRSAKSKLVSLLYGLPGGGALQRVIRYFKSSR